VPRREDETVYRWLLREKRERGERLEERLSSQETFLDVLCVLGLILLILALASA
jgi:hypothetical protein